MGLFSLYPMRYRDRGALVLLIWKPIAAFCAIAVAAWLLRVPPARVLVGVIVLAAAWIVLAGFLRRRGWY